MGTHGELLLQLPSMVAFLQNPLFLSSCADLS